MTPALMVLEAGPSSTIQDAGRYGFLRYGVSTAGPCDTLLHAIANRLVGNSIDTAIIEFTLKGDRYKVAADSVRLAIAGDVAVDIDGAKVPSWRAYTLHEGQILSIGYVTRGVRGYLAVAGGYDLSLALGSLSIHVRSGIGPLGGGAIKSDTVIPIKLSSAPAIPEQELDVSVLPDYTGELRVVLGPQEQHFSADDVTRFTQSPFIVTPKCDRMGYQLSGPKIDYRRDRPLISEGIALGSVQVPGDGLFIVALVDRQTAGGYPKIATVIGPDIRHITQTRPSATIRFQPITVAEARAASQDYAAFINRLDDHLRSPDHAFSSEALLAKNLISGVFFDS